MLTYFLFVVGFILLIKGADLLVHGASSLGYRYKVSSLIIGLTIVSFGTSLPELLVNIFASFSDNSDIGVGNILGSNIANTLLILGTAAVIFPLTINKNTYFIEVPFSLTATLLVGFLANTELIEKDHTISRIDGFILIFFFALFMGYVYVASREKPDEIDDGPGVIETIPKSVFLILIGMVGLFFGGTWVVDSAVIIATQFGLSNAFIGLTIIAIGTSLPELVTSAVAAFKKDVDIAVGNVVGSNIFNLLWVLGISALLRPIEYHEVSNTDIYMIIASSTVLILAIVVGKRARISRWEGMIFLILYFSYIYYLLSRENLI